MRISWRHAGLLPNNICGKADAVDLVRPDGHIAFASAAQDIDPLLVCAELQA
jgi:hypothetical protein